MAASKTAADTNEIEELAALTREEDSNMKNGTQAKPKKKPTL